MHGQNCGPPWPRIRVRAFAGQGFAGSYESYESMVEAGYASGVPMGSDYAGTEAPPPRWRSRAVLTEPLGHEEIGWPRSGMSSPAEAESRRSRSAHASFHLREYPRLDRRSTQHTADECAGDTRCHDILSREEEPGHGRTGAERLREDATR